MWRPRVGLGATVVTNDEIAARALLEQLQQLVLVLQLGQVTSPFGSSRKARLMQVAATIRRPPAAWTSIR